MVAQSVPFEVAIGDLAHDGRGVARVDGKTVFVSGALPGERVMARLTGRHRQFDEAAVIEVLEASPHRVTPRCAHFGVCGGCVLQHLAEDQQILAKQKVLMDNLERIGKVSPAHVLPALRAEPWGYRRRARLSARYVLKKERQLVGFREQDGGKVADLSRCEVLIPELGGRLTELSELIGSLAQREAIPQIELSAGDDQIALIIRHQRPLDSEDRARLLGFAKTAGFALLLQPGGPDSLELLWPERLDLSYRLPNQITLQFEPLDFTQVNGPLNRAMVTQALVLLNPQPGQRLLDLFCGLGNFTLPLARTGALVTGVEGEAGLVARAQANAERNGLSNVRFHLGDLFQDQHDAPWAREDYHSILLDPPRSGAEPVFAYLPGRSVQRILYVSCHPGSLARDAGILVHQHGFRLQSAGVMDMFPHTAHVESMALFERK